MISGAALYRLVLLADRELAQFGSHATRAVRSFWRLPVDGAAHHGTSLHGVPPSKAQRAMSRVDRSGPVASGPTW